MTAPIPVLIADDHPLFRAGLKAVVAGDAGFAVVAEAGDGEETLRLIAETRPRVAVLDMDMPKGNGLQVVRHARTLPAPPAFVMLTMHDEPDLLRRALDAGVLGFVVKESAAHDILACLRMVVQGRPYVSPEMAHHLVPAKSVAAAREPLETLTRAEREVLALVAEGKTTRDVADDLGISPKTVENHRSHICQKLGLTGTNALVRWAIEHRDRLR